jgi:hypothetical protein
LKTSLRIFLASILSLVMSSHGFAQTTVSGVRGSVKSPDDGNLPFATIFVKQTGSGTTTNELGAFEIELAPGWYDLVFQFLGYETTLRKIEITSGFVQLDVTMKPQPTVLPEVVTGGNVEDPAYTIMRKAIAKANYHRNELDWYSARVYIKGVGKLKDYPWLAKKAIEKEGIKKNQAFVTESVSDIKYTRPNKFEEKVISIRSDGKDNNTSPNQFVFGSFYEPMIAETVSPLSPKAFSYYKFEYLGTFKDREYDVSRIKVIPRSKGDDVVDGEILIVENWWSIHSVDLHTTKLGIDIWVKMMSAPVEDKVWLPVSHRFKVDGKFFGFEFEYNYLATVSNYKIQVNPKVYVENKQMEVVDEKIEKEEAKEIEKKQATVKSTKQKAQIDKTKELQERLSSGKEITRKELNTLMKEYEKEEIKKSKEPEVISNTSFKIDSGAYKKDSVYWTHVRPVPLTIDEVVGYAKMDSIAEVKRKEEAGDTLKSSKHKGFQPWDLLIGDNYKIGKHSNFRIDFPMPGFNTVEGFNLVYRVAFGTILQDTNKTRFTISPTFRYAFSREKLTGNLAFVLRNKNYRLELSGGRYIKQFNADEPILPVVNTLTTLFLEENWMKIYERDYIDLKYRQRLSDYVTINTSWSYMTRRELFDSALHIKWVDRKGDEYGYTLNAPVNQELASTTFQEHQAFIGAIGITARPWLKFRIRNERRIEIRNSSPVISFDYRKGLNVLGSDVDFDQIELGLKHEVKIGVRGDLTFALRGGMFLNSSSMYFMDYKHFLGNRTPFSTTDPVGSFRLLDYYNLSTSDKYFAGNVHYHFRKFMVTRIPIVRMTGIRENIFVNYLATNSSENYTEVGYGIDGILRLFRLEFAAAFRNGQYINHGFRIGISTSLTVNFSD